MCTYAYLCQEIGFGLLPRTRAIWRRNLGELVALNELYIDESRAVEGDLEWQREQTVVLEIQVLQCRKGVPQHFGQHGGIESSIGEVQARDAVARRAMESKLCNGKRIVLVSEGASNCSLLLRRQVSTLHWRSRLVTYEIGWVCSSL